ncbi:MAG: hypothetical protein EG828_08000 [Deltaproteobacteria bacterium]|nr:hypothetical protein [Deltaproteobacteria bacterium]
MTRMFTGNRHFTYLLALTVITLAVYFIALNAGFLSVDDTDTISFIQSGKVSVTQLFLAPSKAYYRPLALLSLLGDFHLYGGNPAGYHLTNLLFHLANVLLVYYLATLTMGKDLLNPGIYPFLAALIFAVHPVNSEAVVWISARPDLLCCFFTLLCMVLLVKRSNNVTPLVIAGLFTTLFCSLASKEASLFLPILAPVYFMLHRKNLTIRSGVAACGALLLSTLAYLMLRKGLPLSPNEEFAASTHHASHVSSAIIDGAAAIGFYISKLLYPFPLNIAITEIPATGCVGVLLLSIVAGATLWMKLAALRFPLTFLATSLVPPLGALFLSTAWTPYAERYLYLPSVAFALCSIILLQRYAASVPATALVGCAMLAAIPTVHRVNMWTKPIAFWQDAAAKSPRFGTLRLPLAAEYIETGRFAEAEDTLRRADELGLPLESTRDFSRQLKVLITMRSGSLQATSASRSQAATSGPSGAAKR